MKIFFTSLILFFAILVESVLLPVPVTLVAVVLIGIFVPELAPFYAFFAGLALDLFLPRLLGVDAVFFLIVILLERRYQRKVHTGQIFFYLIFLLATTIIYSMIFYKQWDPVRFAAALVISGGLLYTVSRLLPESDKRKRLSV